MMILSNLPQNKQLCTSTSSLLTKFCISPTSGILDFHFRPPFTCSHLFSSFHTFSPASCQILLFTFLLPTAQLHLFIACWSCSIISPTSNDNTFVLFLYLFLNDFGLYHFLPLLGTLLLRSRTPCLAGQPHSLLLGEKQRRSTGEQPASLSPSTQHSLLLYSAHKNIQHVHLYRTHPVRTKSVKNIWWLKATKYSR